MVNPRLMSYNIENGGILINEEGKGSGSYCLKLK